MRNKGQMFIIIAVILIAVLIILKTSINTLDIIEKNRELEGNFEHDFFVNTVNELTKTIDISYYQPNKITNNVFEFANFTRKKMTEHLQNFKLLYIGSITPATSGNDNMNVTVINLLNKLINVTLNLNGVIKSSTNMEDSTSWDTNFTIAQGNNYILTADYDGNEQNITIGTKVNKSVYVGFFDVTLTGSETTYKDKFQKNYTLP
jgi:hypothetical protein